MVDGTGPQPVIKGPTKLGEYTLLRRIGRGGMAEVYLAKKEGDLVDRNLVVKRMLPHLADDERFVQMFMREARVAMQLSHPNVVQMLEVGVEGEEYFIAMEHLEGLSAYHLAKRVWAAGGSLPLELVAHTLCDAALGLEHAHTLRDLQGNPIGLVHRDISPDNIFVTKDGTSKILDFGIALGAFAGSLTRTGEIKGKVRYMSPEQMTKATGVDARADVFSLGATLYWLLTGRHAFDGDNDVVAMRAVLESEPLPPSAINNSLPPAIDDVVAAMLTKNRDKRVPSAEAAYEMLLPFSGGAAGRNKVVDFLAQALLLPPVKKRAEGEVETPLAVPAAVPWSKLTSPGLAGVGLTMTTPEATERNFPAIPPKRSLEATVRVPVPMSSETPTDTPPEHGTEGGAEPTSSTPFSHVDGETLENALRPKEKRRGGVGLIAAAVVFGVIAAGVAFMVFDANGQRIRDAVVADGSTTGGASGDPSVPSTSPSAHPSTTTPSTPDTNAPNNPVASSDPTPVAMPTTSTTPSIPPATSRADAGPGVVVENNAAAKANEENPGDEAAVAADAGVVIAANANANANLDDKDTGVDDPEPEPTPNDKNPRAKRGPPKPVVKVKGPGHIEWRTVGGALLGKGNDTLTLPHDTKQIVAHDTKRKCKTRVDVDDDVDYASLPKGELSFIVLPFADVFLGKESIGRTPIAGISVVAGTCEVKLVFNDKSKPLKVTVEPGKKETVRANLNNL